MRSILIHLANCAEADVASVLAAAYPAQPGPPWIELVDGDACLYIAAYRDHASELEPHELEELRDRFSGRLPVSLIADVSGRHDSESRVRHLVETLLGRWPGLAEDEFSDHLWTLEEVRQGSTVDRRQFFCPSRRPDDEASDGS